MLTERRHVGRCTAQRSPVSWTLELVYGRRPGKSTSTTTLEAASGQAQEPPRCVQGPRFVRTTVKWQVPCASTATLHLKPCGTAENRLPLVYKMRRWPPSRGAGHGHSNSPVRTHSRYWHLPQSCSINHLAGTWGHPRLSRLTACSPLYEHHSAVQHSAASAHLLDVRPTAGTRINLMSPLLLSTGHRETDLSASIS
jgi:hypothetical protein